MLEVARVVVAVSVCLGMAVGMHARSVSYVIADAGVCCGRGVVRRLCCGCGCHWWWCGDLIFQIFWYSKYVCNVYGGRGKGLNFAPKILCCSDGIS